LEAPIRLAEEVVLVGLGDTAADVVLQAHKKRHATRPAFVVSEVDDIEGNMSGYDSPPGLRSALVLHRRLMAGGSQV
jgi:NADPH-dependent glutamate synthase beta subunit-like oxidoreductase